MMISVSYLSPGEADVSLLDAMKDLLPARHGLQKL